MAWWEVLLAPRDGRPDLLYDVTTDASLALELRDGLSRYVVTYYGRPLTEQHWTIRDSETGREYRGWDLPPGFTRYFGE